MTYASPSCSCWILFLLILAADAEADEGSHPSQCRTVSTEILETDMKANARQNRTFDAAMVTLTRWEGGWSDHADDPGGLTRYGVTLKTMKRNRIDLDGDGKVTRNDLRQLTPEIAEQRIYKPLYWDAVWGDKLPPVAAILTFDAAVNQGPRRAIRFLQKAVGATVDGVMGPETLAHARRAANHPRQLVVRYSAERCLHYSALSHVVTFGRGWFRRVIDVAIEAMQAAR